MNVVSDVAMQKYLTPFDILPLPKNLIKAGKKLQALKRSFTVWNFKYFVVMENI